MSWEFAKARTGPKVEIMFHGIDISDFRWATADGLYLKPSSMTTKHVFYTWLMIWNHAAPSEYRIWFNPKRFSSFYTPDYMLTAFVAMYAELKRRMDIGPRMQHVIDFIEGLYKDSPRLVRQIVQGEASERSLLISE